MITAAHIEVVWKSALIVGSGYARIEAAKPIYDNYAYLGFMYTDQHRGKGVNAIIIEALKEWCLLKNNRTSFRCL
jgi:hypothetical protein